MQKRWKTQAWASLLAAFTSGVLVESFMGWMDSRTSVFVQNIHFLFSAGRGWMISPPGLSCSVANQLFIYGSADQPSHNEPAGYYRSSSLPWNNSSCSICFIISSYLFSLLSQGNTPSSVCVGISGSTRSAQGAGKKGTGRYKPVPRWMWIITKYSWVWPIW